MMPRVSGTEVFGIDWTEFEEVKALAIKLGKGQLVIKYPHRPNYNITHAEQEGRVIIEGADIVWRT